MDISTNQVTQGGHEVQIKVQETWGNNDLVGMYKLKNPVDPRQTWVSTRWDQAGRYKGGYSPGLNLKLPLKQ